MFAGVFVNVAEVLKKVRDIRFISKVMNVTLMDAVKWFIGIWRYFLTIPVLIISPGRTGEKEETAGSQPHLNPADSFLKGFPVPVVEDIIGQDQIK